MAAQTFTKSGNKSTTAARLNKDVFGVEVASHELLKQAYLTHQANARINLAKTKKRGEVRGGGKKPWRQKGTGRARFGSSRVPIWRGGGVVWGPTGNENYSKDINKKAKKAALRQALSLASKEDRLFIIENLEIKDGKTTAVASLLDKLGCKGRTLVAVASKSKEQEKAFKNLSNVKLATATYLNTFDLLNADCIVLTADALTAVHEWLGKTNTKETRGKQPERPIHSVPGALSGDVPRSKGEVKRSRK